ncbi:hypothetical protein [Actinotignum schaalii]|uniref:hypothetical protein n=1 Tax=Actinotignum schaalii TaxID=59505 RepID=UPI00255037D0|nr:hypothetical protein [Actinotignum schaalii]MDK7272188.1 hypothetical protein [Actinotignum schaalii]
MRSTKLMAWAAGAVAALCGVAGLGGCSGGTTPQPPATHLPGAPGDTAQFPSEAIAHGTGEVKVRGGVIISGGVATMCDVFLESSPPQCGGGGRG